MLSSQKHTHTYLHQPFATVIVAAAKSTAKSLPSYRTPEAVVSVILLPIISAGFAIVCVVRESVRRKEA